jgi:hypothetical protein
MERGRKVDERTFIILVLGNISLVHRKEIIYSTPAYCIFKNSTEQLRSFQLQTLKNNCFRQQRSGDIIA